MGNDMTVALAKFMENFTAAERVQVAARTAELIADELTALESQAILSKPSRRRKQNRVATTTKLQ
jgi:hypothetical protein